MNKREIGLIISLLISAILLKLPFAGRVPESWDAVDFALALERYDVRAMQPHFPGYPFFILAGDFFSTFIENEYLSLSLVSVCAGVASIFFFLPIARRMIGERWCYLAIIWLLIHPLIWLTSEQPMSDSLGLFFALWLLERCSRSLEIRSGDESHGWNLVIGAGIFALMLGVRLSYWSLGTILLFPWIRLHRIEEKWDFSLFRLRYLFLAAVVGLSFTFLWIWIASWSEGSILEFLELGQRFTEGHFTQWGGTAWAGDLWWNRIEVFFHWGIWASILGGAITSEPVWQSISAILLILLLLINAWKVRFHERTLLWFLWMIPTGVWVFLGQNVDKPRHLLPLIPGMILLFMRGTILLKQIRWRQKWLLGLLLFPMLVHLYLGIQLVIEYRYQKPPVLQMTTWITKHYPPEKVVVITYEEERVMQVVAPSYDTEMLKSWDVLMDTIVQYQDRPVILITEAVVNGLGEKKKALLPYLKQVTVFKGNQRIDPIYHEIKLYQIQVDVMVSQLKVLYLKGIPKKHLKAICSLK